MRKIEINLTIISKFFKIYFSVFGILWFCIEVLKFVFSNNFDMYTDKYKFFIFMTIVILSLIITLFKNKKRNNAFKYLKTPECAIEVKLGDLFQENNSIVIGYSNCFDTEIGDIIKQTSVQGQFQERVYGNNITQLNNDIVNALNKKKLEVKVLTNKLAGRNTVYPIGTTVALGFPQKRFFLCAYTAMSENCVVNSNSDYLINSLSSLWDEVVASGQGNPISMPVIGSELARTNIPQMALIKFIFLSFMFKSKEGFVTKKLNIIVHPSNKHLVDFDELQSFMDDVVY